MSCPLAVVRSRISCVMEAQKLVSTHQEKGGGEIPTAGTVSWLNPQGSVRGVRQDVIDWHRAAPTLISPFFFYGFVAAPLEALFACGPQQRPSPYTWLLQQKSFPPCAKWQKGPSTKGCWEPPCAIPALSQRKQPLFAFVDNLFHCWR